MKKWIGILLLGGVIVVYATAPFTATVGTDSLQLVAAKPLIGTSAWATNTAYSVGDVVKNGTVYYFATNAGTTTNAAPTHTVGEATYGTMTWRQISKSARTGVAITVQTTSANGGAVNLSIGTDAATNNCGIRLVGEGSTIVFSPADNYNGEIHAVSASGSNVVVGVQEF